MRYQILRSLLSDHKYVSELAEELNRDVTTVSRQLRNLRNQNLVSFRTEGRKVRYKPKRRGLLEALFDLRSKVRREDFGSEDTDRHDQ